MSSRYFWPGFGEPGIAGGRMQSSEIKVSGFGKVAGMPGGVTGPAFSRRWATDRFNSRNWASRSFLEEKP
jgi:hypothetical protein